MGFIVGFDFSYGCRTLVRYLYLCRNLPVRILAVSFNLQANTVSLETQSEDIDGAPSPRETFTFE